MKEQNFIQIINNLSKGYNSLGSEEEFYSNYEQCLISYYESLKFCELYLDEFNELRIE